MTEIDRRAVAFAALGLPLTAAAAADARQATAQPADVHDMSGMPAGWRKSEQIAMLMFPGFTAMDLVGPQYYLSGLMGAKVHIVAKTLAPLTSDTGLTLSPTATFETCPKDLDILFVPGGTMGTLAAMRDPQTVAFVADRGSRAKHVSSVCTGSLLLGAAGLLKGYRATSHWGVRNLLTEFGATPVAERVVIDRNRITGAGVTAGLDLGIAIATQLRDPLYARCQQLISEYDPHPIYDAGSPERAPREAAMVRAMMSGYLKQAAETAHALRV